MLYEVRDYMYAEDENLKAWQNGLLHVVYLCETQGGHGYFGGRGQVAGSAPLLICNSCIKRI